jgi:hypothetical protein
MEARLNRRCVLSTLLLWLLLAGSPLAADSPTQRQWIVDLVTAMGWSFGLPDTPADADYLHILGGGRHLRIEGEDAVQPNDAVSVKTFKTFGDYSGKGWLSGLSTRTTATLRFLLPLGGTYRVSAALRRPGHRIDIAEQSWDADGAQDFGRVELGTIRLAAGPQEIHLDLPPDGGFDYLELDAPNLVSIAPPGGWRLDQPVDLDILALSAIQMLGLEALLPPLSESLTIEAENAVDQTGAEPTEGRHLGEPSGGRWLRAGAQPASVRRAFSLPSAGVYALSLGCAADAPITALLNARQRLSAAPAAFLQERPLGSALLPAGENTLLLTLPPRGGCDYLRLVGRQSRGADYRRLAGLTETGDRPTPALVDRLLALLAAMGEER